MAELRNLERPGFFGKLWGKTLNAFGVPNDFQEDSTSWADAVRNSANYISPYNVGHGGDLEPQVPQAATDFVDANKGMMERMGRSEPEPLDGLMAFGLSSGVGGLGRRVEQRAAGAAEPKPAMAFANADEKSAFAAGAGEQPTMYRGVRMADKPGPISPDSPYYWMTSSPDLASDYALGEQANIHYQSPAVIPAVTDFKNPMMVDAQGQHWMSVPQADGGTRSTDGLAYDAHKQGHDGLIVSNVNDAPYDGMPAQISTVSAALKPGTVKSATTGETLFSNGDEKAGAFSAAASNLPMDQASRMTRAADGGYHINEPVYHETGAKNKIKEFKPGFGTSVWFTTDKSTLGDNGAAGTGQVIEAFLRHKKLAGWDEYDKYSTDQLIQMGYDGARLDKDIVMFSPKGIRDINAAFDPSKSESTDLLAANANPFGAASDFLIPPLAPEDEEFGAFGDAPKR